jgi:hypothetical protein
MMKLFIRELCRVLIAAIVLLATPVQAQVSEQQVNALVEALRLAAPQTGIEDDGLYSDWQIKPDNIVRWSKRCTGAALTPEEFEANPVESREILKCVMSGVLQKQYEASNNDESLAVLRTAAWWMTGDADQYDSDNARSYTNKVLKFYRERL